MNFIPLADSHTLKCFKIFGIRLFLRNDFFNMSLSCHILLFQLNYHFMPEYFVEDLFPKKFLDNMLKYNRTVS